MGQKLLFSHGKTGRSQEMRTELRALTVSECIWQSYSHRRFHSCPDHFKFQQGGFPSCLFCRVITKEESNKQKVTLLRTGEGPMAAAH